MKLAIISDIHGNLAALNAVLADIKKCGVDNVLNLGDILSGSLQPCETADRLIPLNFPTILGNHERQIITLDPQKLSLSDSHALKLLRKDQLNWLRSLPTQLIIEDDVLMVHGIPGNDLEYFLETVTPGGVIPSSPETIESHAKGVTQSLILCGHTHIPRQFKLSDGRLVVNPGSVGLQAYDDVNPCYHKMESGSPHARYAIVESSQYNWQVDFRAIAYDWDSAAGLAAANGRVDCVIPLQKGIVE